MNPATMLLTLSDRFKEGGWGMWPIAGWFVLALAIVFDRAIVLFRPRLDLDLFFDDIERCVRTGQISLALKLCDADDSAVTRLVRDALQVANRPRAQIDSTLIGSILRETPPLEGPTKYLPVLGNLGMLCGLLGTIMGMIPSYGCGGGASIDPGRKAEWLAAGIGEAMNCTAFGLVVAVLAVASHGIFRRVTDAQLEMLDEAAMRIRNLLAFESTDHPEF